jgi:PKD repeat protein
VTSDAGGSAVLPVSITGNAAAPIPVTAQAGPDQTVSSGQLVTLDGSASTNAQTFSWASVAPNTITLNNPNTATPTFTAPAPGVYTFQLTVTGPGGPSSAMVTITVNAAVTAVANAGPNQTGIVRGTKVTLDGSQSTGAGTYAWTQVTKPGDPTVMLNGANTAQPTFTFPFYKYPATNGLLTFNLTVTSPDGSSSQAQVTVTPSHDNVTITKGQYTVSNKQWRIDGTSDALTGEIVTVHLGGLDGPSLGTAVVAVDGTFDLRTTTTGIVGKAGQTVSVESQLGGTAAGFVIKLG